MATPPERLASNADQACVACKRQKRRCDKAVPQCSLCRRTGRMCVYSDASDPPPTAAAFAALQKRLSELEDRLNTTPNTSSGDTSSPAESHRTLSDVGGARNSGQSIVSPSVPMVSEQQEPDFPAALFLDIDCFVWAGIQMPDPSVGIPTDVLALLSQGNVVVDTSADYFSTIHRWMPMVSKKRMHLGIPVRNGGPDLAMLFLAMKLITAQVDEVADGTLYSIAKGFLSGLEGSGVVSLLCLQAMVLIALYEYSHSIYPAAWMTVGACARYADILGLSCGEMDVTFMGQTTTWTGAEERRRVWWAIFILDRIISMGSRRPCSVAEQPPDGRLPADDEAWDAGDVTRAWGHAVSTHYQVHQSYYARLCQAAIYVGRAETLARSKQLMSSSRLTELMSLADELSGFSAVMDNTPGLSNTDSFIRLLAPRCLVRSALFIALDSFTCPEKIIPQAGYIVTSGAKTQEELQMQSRSMQVVQQASRQAHSLAMELSATIESDESLRWQLGKVSPFILDLMYCSMATLHWLLGENGDEVNKSSLSDLEPFMDMLGKRWRLSMKYVEILTFHNVSRRTRNNNEY
ncbi:hypothetical protein BKA64DRAFT_747579 [Cadophora sp. MPI-SDFR-AT-0126]|nr:hypothetical protein BKA64DRAFT_747579 [Leotiomycetes sp. MPI-SDFR-AT-0126]